MAKRTINIRSRPAERYLVREVLIMSRVFAMVGILVVSVSMGFGRSAKISSDLKTGGAGERVAVIVQFSHTPTARHHQKVFSRGGVLRAELGLVKVRLHAPGGGSRRTCQRP